MIEKLKTQEVEMEKISNILCVIEAGHFKIDRFDLLQRKLNPHYLDHLKFICHLISFIINNRGDKADKRKGHYIIFKERNK